MCKVSMQFYGERGVVNGILLDIGNNKDKLDAFFNSIRLFGNRKLPWEQGVEECIWMIEPDLAEFGNPDFIAVIQSHGEKYALFIEAKLLSYADSCFSWTTPFVTDGLNNKSSKLNMQLALRYRFAEAYWTSSALRVPGITPIIEKSFYADFVNSPRKLTQSSFY